VRFRSRPYHEVESTVPATPCPDGWQTPASIGAYEICSLPANPILLFAQPALGCRSRSHGISRLAAKRPQRTNP